MEATELLEREARFRQLNKELEQRTKGLLRQIETAMEKQDSFADISKITFGNHRLSKAHSCQPSPSSTDAEKLPETTSKSAKHSSPKESPPKSSGSNNKKVEGRQERGATCCCLPPDSSKRDGSWEFLEAFIGVNVQDNVLPKSFLKESPSGESVCKFLASKLKLMQEQVDKQQELLDRKAAQCERHMSSHAELEGERLKLLHRADNLRLQGERAARRATALQEQLQECERRYKESRSEADRLGGELKRTSARCAGAEARSAPLEEAAARLRRQLDAATAADKEFRESARVHASSQQEAIDSLEKQKRALLAAVEKQWRLVDNLRRQVGLQAAGAAAGALDGEYGELLAWGAR